MEAVIVKMSRELQQVYDWCEKMKNTLDENAKSSENPKMARMLIDQSIVYWAVQQYIAVNFSEGSKSDVGE